MPGARRRTYTSATTRALAAILILLGTAAAVPAKLLCPPGRFVIDTGGASAVLDGRELVLGHGTMAVAGMCRNAPGRRYLAAHDRWLLHVAARWPRCHGRAMVLRARFDVTAAAYCTQLAGVMRTGRGRRTPFVARRIVECGNGLREAGEQCDGQDGTLFALDCCADDCRVKSGCPVVCEMTRPFPCEGADEICVKDCSFGGVCRRRADVDCGTAPVCDCAGEVTYANRCAAWEAGAGIGRCAVR